MSLIAENVSAASNYETNRDKPNSNLGYMSYQVNFSGLDATDGIISTEYSNDNVNWEEVPGLTETVATASEVVNFNINAINHKFYRIKWVSGSNTAGTFDIYVSS